MSTVPARTGPPDAFRPTREFVVGSRGWTADDLDDPRIESLWYEGRYEIADGVLTRMAAANFDGGSSLLRLVMIVQGHVDAAGVGGEFAVETDLVLGPTRVPRVDALYLTADGLRRQEAVNAARPRRTGKYGRVRVVPTLVVEALSIGHKARDRKTKRDWFAAAGVPHYWLLDAYDRSLACFVLAPGTPEAYRPDAAGRSDEEVRPSLFPGLIIPLGRVWR